MGDCLIARFIWRIRREIAWKKKSMFTGNSYNHFIKNIDAVKSTKNNKNWQHLWTMRHEMEQITQENVTMATVTNSLREIVRSHENKTVELQDKNASMYTDIHQLCQYMQQISGECFLSEDEDAMYSASNLSAMVSAVKQKALSISSSRSSLHANDEDEYAIINHDDHANESENEDSDMNADDDARSDVELDAGDVNETNKACPICEQEFNTIVWRYECTSCQSYHCSICAPIRKKNKTRSQK